VSIENVIAQNTTKQNVTKLQINDISKKTRKALKTLKKSF